MANIQDVAKEAGVSVATVSRVLNNNDYVNDKTREKVLCAIEKLNYKPNLLGRHLRRSETRMILVILHSISNPFFSKVVRGIEDVAHKNGYNIMVCNTYSDESREKSYLELIKNKIIDGAIMLESKLSNEELEELYCDYPIVQCCEKRNGLDLPFVSIDNEVAAQEITEHLIHLGHKRIALISSTDGYDSANARKEGYINALNKHNIKFSEELIKFGDYDYKKSKAVTLELLNLKNPPDAIFAISDIMAMGAIKAVNEKGLKVPFDIAVAGFDNISFSYMYQTELTTVSQNQYEMGSISMEMLLKRIKDKNEVIKSKVVQHRILIRNSTVSK